MCYPNSSLLAVRKEKEMNKVIEYSKCPENLMEKKDGVSYGTVEYVTYFSNTTKLERGANVLLPANYNPEKKYPVIYAQHGILQDEFTLLKDEQNHLPEIAGNLMAAGEARETIIVFSNMFATSDPELKADFNAESVRCYDNFINELINDLMPTIEAKYSVSKDRLDSGIFGFSLGGRESLYIGMTRTDLFAYVGAVSPAPGLTPGKDWAMEHPGMLAEKDLRIAKEEYMPEVLLVSCGTQDKVVGTFPKSYHEIMDRNGVEHIWYEIPEADHDHNAISSAFYNFLKKMNR